MIYLRVYKIDREAASLATDLTVERKSLDRSVSGV